MTDPKSVRPDRAEEGVEDRPKLAAETIKDLPPSPELSDDVRGGPANYTVGGSI